MICAHFLILRARFPVRHARFPVLHFSVRVGVAFVRVLHVGLRVGRFFARSQGIRLRMIRAHFLILRARCPVCRVGVRVRVEGLRGCAEDGGGSGTRRSIALGGGGRNGKGVALDRLLIPLGRRIAPLLRTDGGRGGVARARPFSTLGKGDYRGMGFFILFFSILFSSGGVRIGERGRDVVLLGEFAFPFGGFGVGVGSFVFHFRGFGLGSDRSGGKIARGVLLLGEWGVEFRGLGFALGGRDFIFARRRQLLGRFAFLLGGFGVEFRGVGFALGGCDFIFARRRQLLGGFVFLLGGFGVEFRGVGFALGGCDFIFARRRQLLGGFVFLLSEFAFPFGGCFLLGGGQGVVGRQAAHGTAVGFARRAHPTLPHRAHRAAARRRGVVRQHAPHRGEHRRGESARRAVDVEETEVFHHAPHRGGVLVEIEGQHVVVERRTAVATVAQVREQHDVDADARSAHSAAQTAAVADAEGARIEREIGGEKGHEGRNVFLNV